MRFQFFFSESQSAEEFKSFIGEIYDRIAEELKLLNVHPKAVISLLKNFQDQLTLSEKLNLLRTPLLLLPLNCMLDSFEAQLPKSDDQQLFNLLHSIANLQKNQQLNEQVCIIEWKNKNEE